MTFREFLCGSILCILLLQASALPAGDINQKIASLDMAEADLEDVIAAFGQPQKFIWQNQTFTQDNLPVTYIALYDNGFSIVISKQQDQ